jgi:hypothetical protein
VAGKSIWQGGMEEVPENGKESSHSAHASGMEQNTHTHTHTSLPISDTFKFMCLIFGYLESMWCIKNCGVVISLNAFG